MIQCKPCDGRGVVAPHDPFGLTEKCAQCAGAGEVPFRGLHPGDHCCLFYKDPSRMLDNAVEFLIEGLSRGQQCVYITHDFRPGEVDQKLFLCGIDVIEENRRGALRVLAASDVYLKDGRFDSDRMIQSYDRMLQAGRSRGFAEMRAAAEMSWAPEFGYADALPAYEAAADRYFQENHPPLIGLCQYREDRFVPAMLQAVREVHPHSYRVRSRRSR